MYTAVYMYAVLDQACFQLLLNDQSKESKHAIIINSIITVMQIKQPWVRITTGLVNGNTGVFLTMPLGLAVRSITPLEL